jgi:ribosomal protein S27E
MLRFREQQPPGSSGARPRPDDAGEVVGTGPRIRCRGCGAVLSEPRNIFSPAGSSARSVFANPAGRVFEVLCLREATSVVPWGEPTLEHTWFSGYAWRPVTCASCGSHLGWCFDAMGGALPVRFFGLITSEVVEGDA